MPLGHELNTNSTIENRFYLNDRVGTLKQVYVTTNAQSLPIQRDAWGVLTGSNYIGVGFTGEFNDMVTNLVFLHARWYNPSSGTFLSRDPFAGYDTQPSSLHPYQYGYSSPLVNTDHSGRCAEPISFIACVFLGGAAATAITTWWFEQNDATPGTNWTKVGGAAAVGGLMCTVVVAPVMLPATEGAIPGVATSVGRTLGADGDPTNELDTLSSRGQYLEELAKQMSKPSVNDPQLQKVIDELYRANATYGSGSTADAVRYELANGQLLPNVTQNHIQKAQNFITFAYKWLGKSNGAITHDSAVVSNLLNDMTSALKQPDPHDMISRYGLPGWVFPWNK